MNKIVPQHLVRAFFDDLRAYFKEPVELRRDDIAARQQLLLKKYMSPPGSLTVDHIKELFEKMKGAA